MLLLFGKLYTVLCPGFLDNTKFTLLNREAAAAAAWGNLTCNAGSLPGSNSTGTYRRGVRQEKKRDMEVVDLGAPSHKSTEWVAKFVMNFPK